MRNYSKFIKRFEKSDFASKFPNVQTIDGPAFSKSYVNRSRKFVKKFDNLYESSKSNPYLFYYLTANKRYNNYLGINLIWKIFITLLPLILVTIVINYDSEFKFDFFVFVSKFSNLQLQTTNNLIDYYNSNSDFFNNAIEQIQKQNDLYSFGVNGINLINFDWLVLPLSNFGLFLNNVLLVTGMIFTFIIDLFGNVIALFTALVSSV